MAYGLMPSQSVYSPDAKQMYINGHFCYADKLGIITNGLGIIRHISFFDDSFKEQHPDLIVVKKSDSPDEDKSIADYITRKNSLFSDSAAGAEASALIFSIANTATANNLDAYIS